MDCSVLSAVFLNTPAGKASHYHDCHQLLYVTQGEATVTVAGKTYRARRGTLVLISRFEQHSIVIESGDCCRYSLRISPEPCGGDEQDYYLFTVLVNRPEGFSHAVDLSEYGDEFERLLCRIVDEKAEDIPYTSHMRNLLLREFMVLLFRAHPSLFSRLDNEVAGIIRKIQQRFETDFGNQYTLSSLSEEYHISSYYLSHCFKEITGYSVMSHLQSRRIAAAKKYLAKTSMSIDEIVYLCGFKDSSNFSRTFKKTVGLTPSEFRKKYSGH